jgi:hypothetical protein
MSIENGAPVLACCGAAEHSWETFSVQRDWLPETLCCLVIGESPGEDATKYFYNGRRRKVAVRTIMLRELHRHNLVSEQSLAAFRAAGFVFDHAIRCLLPAKVVKREAALADRCQSPRAGAARHLVPFLQQEAPVWVMGRIARNVVADLCRDFPAHRSDISKPPYPCKLAEAPRFFVSRYLLHASVWEVVQIFSRLHRFLDSTAAAQCPACQDCRGEDGD